MATAQVKLTGKQSLEHNRKGRQRNLSTYWMMSMQLYLKQYSPKIPSTICQKLLKNTGQNKKKKDDASKKSKKNKNDNTTTSPAPEQPAIQPEASSLKQKLAMAK